MRDLRRVLAVCVAAGAAWSGAAALRAQDRPAGGTYGETPEDLVPFRSAEPARR